MNPDERQIWENEALDMVFQAFAAYPGLADSLIYKGARVLSLYLGGSRQSLDIDSTMTVTFVAEKPNKEEQAAFFEEHFAKALHRFFERQEPVRYALEGIRAEARQHQRGWDAIRVRIRLQDQRHPHVRGLPQISVDISAPEDLGPVAVVDLQLNGGKVRAYSLERIAGEKLRAFLSSLPAYRRKMNKPGDMIRVRDLYDLAKILEAKPKEHRGFWSTVAEEFERACRSRFVDCEGIQTFLEEWRETQRAYIESGALPSDVDIAQAERALRSIVAELAKYVAFPLRYTAPPAP